MRLAAIAKSIKASGVCGVHYVGPLREVWIMTAHGIYRLLTDEQKNVIAIATADDLAPLQGEFANSAYMAFYLRTSSHGEKYIVVKDGFSVRAAIMQPDVKEALRDSLLEALTLLRVEGLKDGTVDITRQCWPTGGNEETEADDEET